MAVDLATGYIDLVPSAENIAEKIAKELDLDAVANSAGKAAGQQLADGLLGQAKDTGSKLARDLGLLAVGALAIKSAHDVEGAHNIIIRATGASGDAADRLEESFRKVASGSSASLDTVATTLAELYQRTGLQGKALETLTSQVVTFNRISKDSPITVDSLTKATAGFNVQGAEMGGVLDHLFIISQRTGVPLAQLLGDLQTSGPVLRQFGFDIEFSAGFLARLNKAGVETNQIVPGLRAAFVQFAKDGREPAVALRETLGEIDRLIKTGDEAAARQLAVQLFGARGTGVVDAAINGKLSLQSLNEQVKITGDGIVDTSSKTSTLAGTLGVLRNNATLAFAGFATPALQVANDALKDILPTVQSLSRDFADLPDSIQLGAVGAAGLAFGLGKVGEFVTNAGPGLASLGHLTADGLTLAAVKGLELVDTLKAISLQQALVAGGVLFGVGAVGALLLALNSGEDEYTRINNSAKQWAQTTIAGARSSANELANLRANASGLRREIGGLSGQFIDINDSAQTAAVGGLEAANQKNTELARKIELLKTRLRDLQPEIDSVQQKHRDEGASARETASSLDTYTTATENGTNASSALSKLTDEAKQALDGLQSALIQAAGGEVGYQEAILTRDDAQDRANTTFLSLLAAIKAHDDAVVQFGEDSDQARATEDALTDAQRENAGAQLELKQANLNLGQATIALTDNQAKLLDSLGLVGETRAQQLGGIDAEIAKYQQLQRDYPATADSLNPYLFQLIQLRQKIEEVPTGPQPATTFSINVEGLQQAAALADLFALFNDIPRSEIDPIAGIIGLAHATGGIFTKTHVGVVAEAGPEAILPLSDPRRSWALIAQAGLLNTLPAPVATGGGAPLIGEVSYHGDVDDPVRNAAHIARDLRVRQMLVRR